VLVARVADGAMGRVYEGRHPDTRARIAIKVLHENVARDRVAVERFKREFDVAHEMSHPNILKVIEFGSDLGYLNWKDIGLNPYGNSLIVNGAFLEKNPKLVEDFVRISQKAFAACVADVAPCLKALLDSVSGLDKENQERQWERIKFLMKDEFTTTKALGWIDGERMKKDYDLVQTYLGMEKPFDVQTAFMSGMLDTTIKMDAGKARK